MFMIKSLHVQQFHHVIRRLSLVVDLFKLCAFEINCTKKSVKR